MPVSLHSAECTLYTVDLNHKHVERKIETETDR